MRQRAANDAAINFGRQNLVFIVSPISHGFSFAPAVLLMVYLANKAKLERMLGGRFYDHFGLWCQLNMPTGGPCLSRERVLSNTHWRPFTAMLNGS